MTVVTEQIPAIQIHHGDCLNIAEALPDQSVSLIVTSPPYAERRAGHYDGISEIDYPNWFLDRAMSLMRILKDDGSFVVNIKEHVQDNQRSLYVYNTVIKMVEAGWMWRDEFIWNKTNPFPNHGKYRLKDGWERIYHFSKQKEIALHKENVREPRTKERKAGIDSNRDRFSKVGNQYRMNDYQSAQNKFVIPSNVVTTGLGSTAVQGSKWHPAVFPAKLPEFFIKLFTMEGEIVLDPFAGSGTTLRVAVGLNRLAVGIDSNLEYVENMRQELLATDEPPNELFGKK